MRVFVRAVITGFGLSVGKALYDKVAERFLGQTEHQRTDDDQPEPVMFDDAEPVCDSV